MAESLPVPAPPPPPSLWALARYFLRLGALGFGGPVALANAMRRDLVEQRRWLSEAEYDDGLAIAAACPGPLAYQLGVYCGYIRHGVTGGLAAAAAFALAPYLLVTATAWAYVRLGDAWQIRALFYGIAPVVVSLILKACWNLGRKTLRRDGLAWLFFALSGVITVMVERELTVLFLIAGALGTVLFAPPPAGAAATLQPAATPGPATDKLPALAPAAAVVGGISALTAKIFWFFFKTGMLVFGSGLVIVPFLKTYIVDQYHWLDNRQFLDSVAIGMISPGPVVITATFVGFLLNGWAGATAATIGQSLPEEERSQGEHGDGGGRPVGDRRPPDQEGGAHEHSHDGDGDAADEAAQPAAAAVAEQQRGGEDGQQDRRRRSPCWWPWAPCWASRRTGCALPEPAVQRSLYGADLRARQPSRRPAAWRLRSYIRASARSIAASRAAARPNGAMPKDTDSGSSARGGSARAGTPPLPASRAG
ncbi:MAG TPA: chromate efflux transporter, partial [Thermoanaerobaculia bacterium]|nr:chromate efflux transporter [Thermoanaerobaculia bacterium]